MTFSDGRSTQIPRQLPRTWCRKIQHGIEQIPNPHHIAEERKRDQQSPPETVRAIVSFDDKAITSTETESKKNRDVQQSIRNAAWSAFIAACIYALISLAILCQMIAQSKIFQSQLNEMHEATRPWVAIDNADDKGATPYESLTVEKGKVMFPLRYSLRNFGQSPADVVVNAKAVSIKYGQTVALQAEVDKYCNETFEFLIEVGFKRGATIVPGKMNYNHTANMDIPPEFQDTQTIEPTLVGCIWYRSTTGDTRTIHKTQFSGQITVAMENGVVVEAPKAFAIQLSKNSLPAKEWKVVDVLIKGTEDYPQTQNPN